MKEGVPVFVKIDEFKDLLDVMSLIKDKVEESRATLGRLNEIKNEEDAELDQWKNELDEIERKLHYIDRSLFQQNQ